MGAPLWTEEQQQLLKAKWLAREQSAELIAEELSRAGNRKITRNAVLGRLHRDGLLGRSKVARPKQQKLRLRRAPKVFEQVSEKLEPFEWRSPQPGEGVALLKLKAHSCRWPLAAYHEVALRFCGARAVSGSYCALHAHYAFARRVT
jgi:hypothetical protein